MREFRNLLQDVTAEFGEQLAPTLAKLVTIGTTFLRLLEDMSPLEKSLIAHTVALAAGIIGLVGSLMTAALLFSQIKVAWAAFAAIIPKVGAAIGGLTAGLTLLNPWVVGIAALIAVITLALIRKTWALQNASQAVEENESAVESLSGALENLQEHLGRIAPAMRLVAQAELVRAMRDIDAQISAIGHSLQGIRNQLHDLLMLEWSLDDALQSYVDNLRRVEASVKLIVIPLQRQRRELERQREATEAMVEAEKERLDLYLKELEAQIEKMEELLALDQERLQFIDHALFIERLRNKIIGRETSLRALQLRSEKMAQEDIVARGEEQLAAAKDQYSAEKDRIAALEEIAEKQLKAIDAQIAALDRQIAMEQERAIYAREEYDMAQARQVEERIALEARQKALGREQTLQQHRADILRDQRKYLQDQLKTLKRQTEEAERLAKEIRKHPGLWKSAAEAMDATLERWAKMREDADAIVRSMERIKELAPEITPTQEAWMEQLITGARPGEPAVRPAPTDEERRQQIIDMFGPGVFGEDTGAGELPAPPVEEEPTVEIPYQPYVLPEVSDIAQGWLDYLEQAGAVTAPPEPPVPSDTDALQDLLETEALGGLGEQVQGFAPQGATTIVNNYITTNGPEFNVEANYHETQSPASILDDLNLASSIIP